MSRNALSLAGVSIGIATALLASSKIKADELADTLAPQFVYMEACKDIAPPLPPDRLRIIDALHEIVDEGELRKSIMRLIVKVAGTKEKVAAFCSTMATMIKNEKGHDR
jgi:hypothetical protein